MLSAGFGLSSQEIDTMLGVQSQAFSEPTWGEEDDEDYGWGDEEFKVLEVVASKFGILPQRKTSFQLMTEAHLIELVYLLTLPQID